LIQDQKKLKQNETVTCALLIVQLDHKEASHSERMLLICGVHPETRCEMK